MGAYRNMNVLDAGVVVVRDGRQFNLRASTSLGTDFESTCGPISVEVIEPLQQLRLRFEDPEGRLSADLTWTGIAPPPLEKPPFEPDVRRTKEDYPRFNQYRPVQGRIRARSD